MGEIEQKNLSFETTISVKTVYNYIDKGIFLGITNKDLPDKARRKSGRHKPKRVRISNTKGNSIEQRPITVDEREEYGHWEMDCVERGKYNGKTVLLVLTERKTHEEVTKKMKDATQASVIE